MWFPRTKTDVLHSPAGLMSVQCDIRCCENGMLSHALQKARYCSGRPRETRMSLSLAGSRLATRTLFQRKCSRICSEGDEVFIITKLECESINVVQVRGIK
jgi:hypothetical protein